MERNKLLNLIKEGKTTREIGPLVGLGYRTVSYWIVKYGLQEYLKYPKYEPYSISRIDTKEKAYLLGFIIGDGYLGLNDVVTITVAEKDLELVEFFSEILKSKYKIYPYLDRKSRRFPHISITRKISGITQILSGRLKKERHFPIISPRLTRYMLQGFFDAEGCITWGRRKDRNRIWQKVSFTSAYNPLIAVQQILLKEGISTIVRPKGDEDCFILEFANRPQVLQFMSWIYQDLEFLPLKRKFNNYQALRLELGEFGETVKNNTIPSRAVDHSTEGVETTGGKMDSLNNQQENPRQLTLF